MLKVLLLLENQRNTLDDHISSAENHTSRKSKGFVMNQPKHKPRKLISGDERGDNVAVPVQLLIVGEAILEISLVSQLTDEKTQANTA
ncbi:hypothetical protein PoB_000262000 [Plakobranchus ocellatus]|uniref:Uncharacterized protein n=1 Tax=Plakobranchus ocellatus TaxID=259542 RepID=A0AAV3XZ57_9GAST|nr:hypothetical protein PoB_000262000 [Plakobranchus ocellatus]